MNDLEQSLSEPSPEIVPQKQEKQEIPKYAKDIYNKKFTISGELFGVGYEISIIIHKDNTLDFFIKLKGHKYIFNKKIYTDLDFLNDTQPNIDIIGYEPGSPELVFTIRNCTFTTKLVRGNNCEIIIDDTYKQLIDLILQNIRPNIAWAMRPKSISIGEIIYDNTNQHIILISNKSGKIEENILIRGNKKKTLKKNKSKKKKKSYKKKTRKNTRKKTRRKKITTKKRKTKKKVEDN